MSDVYDSVLLKLEKLEFLGDQITQMREVAKRLPELEREYREVHEALTKDLDSMDVTSRGNYGWERRIVPFLAELRGRIKGSSPA
jgi:hypothetical protein